MKYTQKKDMIGIINLKIGLLEKNISMFDDGKNFCGIREYPIDWGKSQSQLVYSPKDYGSLAYK